MWCKKDIVHGWFHHQRKECSHFSSLRYTSPLQLPKGIHTFETRPCIYTFVASLPLKKVTRQTLSWKTSHPILRHFICVSHHIQVAFPMRSAKHIPLTWAQWPFRGGSTSQDNVPLPNVKKTILSMESTSKSECNDQHSCIKVFSHTLPFRESEVLSESIPRFWTEDQHVTVNNALPLKSPVSQHNLDRPSRPFAWPGIRPSQDGKIIDFL